VKLRAGALGGRARCARGVRGSSGWQLRLSTCGARQAAARALPGDRPSRAGRRNDHRARIVREPRPSSWRSILEPEKITIKGGACGAVTRDSLRSPLTLIFSGT